MGIDSVPSKQVSMEQLISHLTMRGWDVTFKSFDNKYVSACVELPGQNPGAKPFSWGESAYRALLAACGAAGITGLPSETNPAPLFPPTEPWPSSLGEQCPQYWGRLERRCQLTEGHEGACYFCVPAYAIRTDIQIDGPSVKATVCQCDPNPSIGGSPPCPVHDGESEDV